MASSLTVEQIAYALRQSAGNVTMAARGLNVSREHLHRRIADSPTLKQTVQDERESLVDIAESALRKKVLEGDMTAIIWTLKANPAAKSRGWGERQEVTGANGGDISTRIVINYADPDPNAT